MTKRTVLALGAFVALGACTTTDPEPATKALGSVSDDAELTADESVVVDQLSLEVAWAGLSADDRETMCNGRAMLDDDQLRLMSAAFAPDIDSAVLIQLLNEEC
jgi:hypothetical protein